MPEYVMPIKSDLRKDYLDEFTLGYIEAMCWTECNPDNPDLDGLGLDDLTEESFSAAVEDCKVFQQSHAADLERAYAKPDYDAGRAGHDFWLSRNGHGVGFFDRDLGEVGDRLQDAARSSGAVDIDEGDFIAPEDRLMSPKEAWGYAASWGSMMTSGDPGAVMYGFDENGRPQSEEHRAEVIAWMKGCREDVVERPEDYDDGELAKLDGFIRYIEQAPVLEPEPSPKPM